MLDVERNFEKVAQAPYCTAIVPTFRCSTCEMLLLFDGMDQRFAGDAHDLRIWHLSVLWTLQLSPRVTNVVLIDGTSMHRWHVWC